MAAKIPMAKLDFNRWSCGTGADYDDPKFKDQQPIDHAQKTLLSAAILEPDSWVWDPKLAEIFDRLNERYFQGRVCSHKLFWFHESQLKDHELETVFMYNRISYTYGYRIDWTEISGERYIGLHARLKLMPDKLHQTLRHEMVHDLVGNEKHHGPKFREELRRQGPGEPWVDKQARAFESIERVQDIVRAAMMTPWKAGDGHDPDRDLKLVRAAIAEHGITPEELHRSVEQLSPGARVLVLRLVDLDVDRAFYGRKYEDEDERAPAHAL